MGLKEKIALKIFQKMLAICVKDLPQPMYNPGETLEFSVLMPDGVGLSTHVYLPDEDGKYPVIFVRSPYVYGFDFQLEIFREFVKYGFILCYQECRGRGTSGGEWDPLVNERADGIAALEWLRKQSFYSGKLALLGNSYLSLTQLVTADLWEDVVGAFLPVFPPDGYDSYYNNGMFREHFMTVWTFQNNPVKNMESNDALAAFEKTKCVYPRKSAPVSVLGGEIKAHTRVLNAADKSDSLWSELGIPPIEKWRAPVFLLGGWYDFSVSSQFASFERLPAEIREKSRLVIGPWGHSMINTGDMKTPNAGMAGLEGLRFALEWFLHLFYGYDPKYGGDTMLYVTDGDGYISSHGLPARENTRLYLNYGRLTAETATGSNTFVYDPRDPVATVGGGGITPALFPKVRLPKQCSSIVPLKKRADTLMYVSEPVKADSVLLGAAVVSLRIATDAPDTCFSVRLCKQKGRRAYYIADGITSVIYNGGHRSEYTPNEERVLTIALNPNAYKLLKGERLILLISSSDSPAYHTHRNTASAWGEETDGGAPARQTVFYGEDSFIDLPFAK